VKPFRDVLTHSFVSHVEGWKNICNGVFGFPKGSKFLEYVFRALEWNMNVIHAIFLCYSLDRW